MKQLVVFTAVWLSVWQQTLAQNMGSCSFINLNSGSVQKLNYSVSKTANGNVFETTYVVFDNNKIPYKIITLANQTGIQVIRITIRNKNGEPEEEYPVNYNQFSGLILTETGDSIVQLDKEYHYLYLFSFDEPAKQYVNTHYLTQANYALYFSRVPDSVVSANKEYLKQAAMLRQMLEKQEVEKRAAEEKRQQQEAYDRLTDSIANEKVKRLIAQTTEKAALKPAAETAPAAPPDNSFAQLIIMQMDTFFKKLVDDTLRIDQIKNSINGELKKYKQDDYDVAGETRYAGDRKGMSWQGNGLLVVDNRKVYKGEFQKGQFVSGTVILRYGNGVKYIGGYEYSQPKGFGGYTYANGDFTIGWFNEAGFQKGAVKQTDKDKNFYFGQYTIDKRNGMGYYVSAKGNLYIGLFNNDQLKNGYSYQIDEVGLKTYFVVNNFIKTPIDYTEWEKFMLAYKKLQSIYNF